ncbi:MAG: C45 family peptidase [Verrucomicrobiales bacterium]
MKLILRLLKILAALLAIFCIGVFFAWRFYFTDANSRGFAEAATGVLAVLEPPPPGVSGRPFFAKLRIAKADGLADELLGREIDFAFLPPHHARLEAEVDGQRFAIGRNGEEIWIAAPDKDLFIAGAEDVPRFKSNPASALPADLPPLILPFDPELLKALPAIVDAGAPEERALADGGTARVHRGMLKPGARNRFDLPGGTFTFGIRPADGIPAVIGYADGAGLDIEIELLGARVGAAGEAPPQGWGIPAPAGAPVERVALAHLQRFAEAAVGAMGGEIAPLPAATGEKVLVARSGEGRLELHDGVRVLFVKGTPEEMGAQQGELLRGEVRSVVERILYGVGVGSSFDKGRWFFEEIEDAQARLMAHMDPRYLREMDALAAAAGLEKEEVRLANFFPELFHCSGFAIHGPATEGGTLYHGRVLDYLRGVGLEQNAAVAIVQPDQGNAWVNLGYAGFIGSITAMNEKGIAIGEMGGRGEGNWDGKPMAQLMREVMEKASTLGEAVEIMRRGPRTCEYYYVISDAHADRAVGIAATPDTFETVYSGESHPKLPHAIGGAVLMSSGDRYEELARRVQAGHGTFDAQGALDLMTRPVCMNSNIQSALFAPQTLDFWIANADGENVASHTRYTKFNLGDLLKSAPAPAAAAR